MCQNIFRKVGVGVLKNCIVFFFVFFLFFSSHSLYIASYETNRWIDFVVVCTLKVYDRGVIVYQKI